MTGLELKLSRELLGLSQYEAAEHIGKVHQRTWAFWETGRTPVKADVAEFMQNLLNRRHEIIKQFSNSQAVEDAHKVVVVYYDTPEFCASYLDWRFSQSIARTLALDFGVSLVVFNNNSFLDFCKKENLKDTTENRSLWAVLEHSKKCGNFQK